MASLTPEQIAQFHEDGFLIVENLLNADLVNRLVERVAPLFASQFETGVYPDEWYWNPKLGLPGASGQMSNVWKSDRFLASVTLSAQIGEISAALGNWNGTRILSDSLWMKPYGASETPLHQDSCIATTTRRKRLWFVGLRSTMRFPKPVRSSTCAVLIVGRYPVQCQNSMHRAKATVGKWSKQQSGQA